MKDRKRKSQATPIHWMTCFLLAEADIGIGIAAVAKSFLEAREKL